jgi:hypothetical protein
MSEFPMGENVIVVDNMFDNYVLGYDQSSGSVRVWCEWCDACVVTFDHDYVEELDEKDLYKEIVDEHKRRGVY